MRPPCIRAAWGSFDRPLALLISVWVGCLSYSSSATATATVEVVEVRMGGAIALSGKHTSTAASCISGWVLWAETLNARGGIPLSDGRVAVIKQPFDLRDDLSEGTESQRVLTDMLNESSPSFAALDFIIGPFSSGISKINSEVAKAAGRILFAHGASESIYDAGNEYVFTTMTPGRKYMGSGLELLRDKGAETVVIAHESSAFPRSVCQGANETAHELGLQVVGYFDYESGQTNFADIVFEIRQLNADVYVGCGHIDDVTYLVGSANILNVNPDAMLVTLASDERIIQNLGAQYSHGLLSPTQWDEGLLFSDDDGFFGTAKNFSNTYLARYGSPPAYHAAFSAAMGYALQKAIEFTGSLETEIVRDKLHSMTVNSFYGPIDFSAPGDSSGLVGTMPRRPMVTTQVQYGAINVVAPVEDASGQAIYPIPTWAQKELMLYPCQQGRFDTGQQELNGSVICAACPAGEYRDASMVTCTPCQSGRFAALHGSSECLPCPAGTQASDTLGSTTCIPCTAGAFCSEGTALPVQCPSGHFCETGSSLPEPCPAGTFTNELGGADLASCLPCSLGYFSKKAGASECEPCPRGWRNAQLGQRSCTRCPFDTYQDEVGQSECTPCNATFYTEFAGATSSEACQCLAGTYLDQRANTCRKCTEGMVCPGGESVPFVSEGYYAEVVGSLEEGRGHPNAFARLNVWACPRPSERMCPGRQVSIVGSQPDEEVEDLVLEDVRFPGECPQHHIGLLCAQCESGYWLFYGRCRKCSPAHKLLLFPVLAISTVLLTFLIYTLGQPSANRAFTSTRLLHCTLGVLLSFSQLLVVLTSLEFQYHSELGLTAASLRPLLLDNIPGLALDCVMEPSIESQYLFKLALVAAIVVSFFGNWFMSKVLSLCTARRIPSMDFDRTVNTCGVFFQTMYLAISKISLGYFECRDAIVGSATLIDYPGVVCWSDSHSRLLPYGVLAILLYQIGMLAVVITILCMTPKFYRTSRSFRQRMKFLVVQWRPDRWYWGAVCIGRSCCIALVTVAFAGDVLSQAMVMLLIVGTSLLGLATHWPWCDRLYNWLDLSLTASFSVILTLTMKYIAGSGTNRVDGSTRTTLATAMQLIIIAVVTCLSIVIAFCLVLYGRKEAMQKQHKEHLLQLSTRYIELCSRLSTFETSVMVTALNQYPSVDLRKIERALLLLGAGSTSTGTRQTMNSTGTSIVSSLWRRKTNGRSSTSSVGGSTPRRQLRSGTVEILDAVFRTTGYLNRTLSRLSHDAAAKMDAAQAFESEQASRSDRASVNHSNLSNLSLSSLRLDGLPEFDTDGGQQGAMSPLSHITEGSSTM